MCSDSRWASPISEHTSFWRGNTLPPGMMTEALGGALSVSGCLSHRIHRAKHRAVVSCVSALRSLTHHRYSTTSTPFHPATVFGWKELSHMLDAIGEVSWGAHPLILSFISDHSAPKPLAWMSLLEHSNHISTSLSYRQAKGGESKGDVGVLFCGLDDHLVDMEVLRVAAEVEFVLLWRCKAPLVLVGRVWTPLPSTTNV